MLIKYIISDPKILGNKCNIFEGRSQYHTFNKNFNEVAKSQNNEFIAVSIITESFGTNYIQKWAATYVSTWCTMSPHISSICLRENLTIGILKEKQIKYAIAGDKCFGRCVIRISILLIFLCFISICQFTNFPE